MITVAARCPNGKCEGVCLCVPNEAKKREIKDRIAEKRGK